MFKAAGADLGSAPLDRGSVIRSIPTLIEFQPVFFLLNIQAPNCTNILPVYKLQSSEPDYHSIKNALQKQSQQIFLTSNAQTKRRPELNDEKVI